ncbi:MAG: YqeG family HAD IIIA-type phosphatase [Armatimonadota bacterium]
MLRRFSKIFHKFRPHHTVRCVEELDCHALAARGIRGVMLDLDNTLTNYRCQRVTPEVEAWIEQLREAGLHACVVTNARTICRVQPVAERLGLPMVTAAYKPFAAGFKRGMSVMGTTPGTTAMVGDLMTMDICGGNKLGIFTVLVEPRSKGEALPTRVFQRPFEWFLRRIFKWAHGAIAHMHVIHPKS